MLNGLDLFAGFGGFALALKNWVRVVCYVEIEPFCQAVLGSRFWDGSLEIAPIWDDVRTFTAPTLREATPIDIISAGFPCQDISTMGNGEGLAGKRSGLFYELIRITKEIRPPFVFIENVGQGTTEAVQREICRQFQSINYTARTLKISALQVGANHERIRFFCLAHSNSSRLRKPEGRGQRENGPSEEKYFDPAWWTCEPGVSGVVNGLSCRMDRNRGLGNAVVPIQAKTAFERLMGLNPVALNLDFLHT